MTINSENKQWLKPGQAAMGPQPLRSKACMMLTAVAAPLMMGGSDSSVRFVS